MSKSSQRRASLYKQGIRDGERFRKPFRHRDSQDYLKGFKRGSNNFQKGLKDFRHEARVSEYRLNYLHRLAKIMPHIILIIATVVLLAYLSMIPSPK